MYTYKNLTPNGANFRAIQLYTIDNHYSSVTSMRQNRAIELYSASLIQSA